MWRRALSQSSFRLMFVTNPSIISKIIKSKRVTNLPKLNLFGTTSFEPSMKMLFKSFVAFQTSPTRSPNS